MYRVGKVLNHNCIIGIDDADNKEYLLMGKGVGFGKKVSQYMDVRPDDIVYSLQELTDRGAAKDIIKSVSPVCLELAGAVLGEAEKEFGTIDRSILFPMADHIEYAVKRIQNQEQISNPLTDDIRVLFYKEYKVAQCIGPLLLERLDIQIDEHEIGYIALHIHSAINDEKVSTAMQMARAVRDCISLIEAETGISIDVTSLSYNRLMNHVRYMMARAMKKESLKLCMNDYISVKFPQAFQIASTVCDEISHTLNCKLEDMEIGYLAMHIARVVQDELEREY